MKGILVIAMGLILTAGVVGGSVAWAKAANNAEVEEAAAARHAVLTYLGEHEAQNAPSQDIEWHEVDITPPGMVGSVHREFISEPPWSTLPSEWTVTVSYPVVPPEMRVYQVVVSSVKLGLHWKGSVEADGSVTELSPLRQMTKEESRRIAEDFLRHSPTFAFDGIEDTLKLANVLTARCPYSWVFIFEFDSANAGYGDRTGQALAEVETQHTVSIAVEQLEVISAVMDNKWDMIKQQMIAEQEDPEGTISVVELIANPVYNTKVRIYGKVSLLGELFCPCFELISGEEKVLVWYGLMVEDDGAERPPVSVEGIENGDWVVVTGELKREGKHTNLNDFRAEHIETMGVVEVPAPIESVEVLIMKSFPPQYAVRVVSGLRHGLVKFDHLTWERHGDTIRVEVFNVEPANKDEVGPPVYGTVENIIELGADFASGKTYTVVVNDVTETFVAQ